MQQPRQLATWNPDRDLWETDQLSIFGPLVAYSETLPRSGMTRDGKLYELPMSAHRTTGRGSSLSPSLPTPTAVHRDRSPEEIAEREKTRPLYSANLDEFPLRVFHRHMLPTVTAADADKARDNPRTSSTQKLPHNGNGMMPPGAVRELLPTPTVGNATGTNERRGGARGGEMLLPGVAVAAATGELLPTPKARDSLDATLDRGSGLSGAAHSGINWGRYEAAIRRWESVLRRPAPNPTELNRNGNPRLNPALSEWMMGLPAGWVTDPAIGISRTHQLKAIGNGVCPQQALAALAILDPQAAGVSAYGDAAPLYWQAGWRGVPGMTAKHFDLFTAKVDVRDEGQCWHWTAAHPDRGRCVHLGAKGSRPERTVIGTKTQEES